MLFQMSVTINESSIGNAVKFTRLPLVLRSCTVDSTSCTVRESSIHVKSCKVRVKFSCEFKKPSYLQIYWIISLCIAKCMLVD